MLSLEVYNAIDALCSNFGRLKKTIQTPVLFAHLAQ